MVFKSSKGQTVEIFHILFSLSHLTLKELQIFFFFWIRFYLLFEEISQFGKGIRLINGHGSVLIFLDLLVFDSIWTSMDVDMKLHAILNFALLIT